ncbi:F-type H+-transporting ATPase subunit gamma [Mycoplasmopsis mustelae]|uniref:ATP synthase gamma chain n=1 Tax=Mycoplasmopsis mustelae TaxID=171289 RepID=A0A4V3FNW6_9BACT|nr:ATP synthase F1 subunit gamma [Mycoplasmopsis mustelae]TDV24100.1 F-type H+-transporting ATPase subunit gamma [Mycoplasmopsis mustelae]
MPSLNSLKNRISVVSNTQKITNAMELVSTSKLRRLRNEHIQIQSYKDTLDDTFNELILHVQPRDFYEIFPQNKEIDASLYVVVTSDLGLCGSYNSNIFKLLNENVKTQDQIVVIGTKGYGLLNSSSHKAQILNAYTNIGDKLSYTICNEITKTAFDLYSHKKINQVHLIYTSFINNLNQEATIKKLFPLDISEKTLVGSDIEFEPNAESVLLNSVPMYISSMIYTLAFESKISEMASRRNAMENATNNADDLIKELKLEFNRQRQSIITQEITEIVAGADAT